MSPRDALEWAALAGGLWIAWRAYSAAADASGAVAGALDALAEVPGRVADVIRAGVQVDPDKPSPTVSGPFVPTQKRDVSPLVRYFDEQGTGRAQIDSARSKGWTQAEIQAAVDTVAAYPFGWS